MFLVSVKCEYKNKIKRKLSETYNKKITIFTEDDILYQKYRNYKYVITDYNKDIINHFTKENKTVIVMDSKKYESKLKNTNTYFCTCFEEIEEIIGRKVEKNYSLLKFSTSIAVVLIMICAFSISFQNEKNMNIKNLENNLNQINKNNNEKKEIDYKSQNYLFLGDSITEFYHLEDYYDKKLYVVNSGISGNSTYNILDDMYNRVYKYNPTKVFLLIGTNDLSHQTDNQIINNINEIVKLIHKNRNKTEIYVESIYPVNNVTEGNDIVIDWMVAERNNDRIKGINKVLKENSKKYDYTYLDLYSKLEDEDGLLKLDYTVDGLHISDEGYKLITKEIMKVIEGKI